MALSEKRALEDTMDLLQDRLRNECACYTSVLSATSFLTRHIRVRHHSRNIPSFEAVRPCTYSELSNSLLIKHIVKSAFPTVVTATIKVDSHIACRAHAAPMLFPCHAGPLRV